MAHLLDCYSLDSLDSSVGAIMNNQVPQKLLNDLKTAFVADEWGLVEIIAQRIYIAGRTFEVQESMDKLKELS